LLIVLQGYAVVRVPECGDGLTAVKNIFFVFRRAALSIAKIGFIVLMF
jgi:hypothetical protein